MFPAKRPSSVRHALIAAALCSVLAVPSESTAAALGTASVRSFLGQPLDADIEFAALSAMEAESLAVRIAPAELFAEAGIDYNALVRSLRISLEKRGDRQLIQVRSDLPVNDPFVTILIELNANGSRLVREYSLLIDPPAIETATNIPNPGAVTLPQPAAAAQPSTAQVPAVPPRPAAPAAITVRPGQTLNAVAARVQPEGVRLEQVLVALQNANPEAFVGRNINRVRSGSVLLIPGADEMRGIDPVNARRSIRAQTADFLRYQKALAERVAATRPRPAEPDEPAAATARSSSGRVGVQLAEPGVPSDARDRLTLSAPAGTPKSGEALDRIATDKALSDANARIAALEKSINDMQQLLALQNKGLADAGQRAKEPAAAVSAPQPAPGKADSAPATGDAPADTSSGTPAAAAVAEPASTARPAPVPPPVPQPDPALTGTGGTPAADPWAGRLQDPKLQAALAAGLLLPLLGWLAWHRRRRSAGGKAARAPRSDATAAATQTVIAEAGGRHVDTSHSVFHSNFVPSVSQIDAKEVDALAEADVYIAYGRDAQAEEILLDALRLHPDRHALRVKLLEIHAARQDKVEFGKLAAELRAFTHGRGEDWAQAARLGQLLDPGNHLYGPPTRPETPSTGTEPSATDSRPVASPVADFELKLEGLLDERRKEGAPAAMFTPPAAAAPDFGLSGISPDISGARERIEPRLDTERDTAALTTKLDLALACQEIGDKEGARELLNEVASARNADLAQRAQSLLKQLA